MKGLIIGFAIAALLAPLMAAAVAPGAYGCEYLEGADAAGVRVKIEPREVDVACTVDVGAVSPGTHRVKVFARPPVWGSAEIAFSFRVAKPANERSPR